MVLTSTQTLWTTGIGTAIGLILAIYLVHTKKHFPAGLSFIFTGLTLNTLETNIPGTETILAAPIWLLYIIGIYYTFKGLLETQIV